MKSQSIDGKNVPVLPSTASPSAVTLYLDIPDSIEVIVKGASGSSEFSNGVSLDLNLICDKEDYTVVFQAVNESKIFQYELTFLFSENISALYMVSDDPINKGRLWVEESLDKSNKATGSMIMQNAEGSIVYEGGLTQIKGRGNTTWKYEKRPYQIKLEKKTDLLETGKSSNKSKTWILLANYLDPTLMRNVLALNLGNAMGMEYNIESRYVDLYYDGEYRGCYLLTEKVEVGNDRVNILDLEELNEDVNTNVNLELLSRKTDVTDNGATYTYCSGMNSPDNISGGYLLEMDIASRAVEEACYFYTTRGNYLVVKSPEFASKDEMEYIAELYQEFEDAVYNGGVNSSTGKEYTEYVDLNSMVQCYLINEFSKNRDGFVSSAYLYKDSDEEIMHMGPLWDYDLSLGIGGGVINENVGYEGVYTARFGIGSQLCKIDTFVEGVKLVYENTLYPLIKDIVLGGCRKCK